MQSVALITDQDNDEQDLNKVQLMTVHLAKGLEFPYVYIVGMEENLFPSAMNLNSRNELEEEEEVVLCCFNSAEKKVFLSYVLSRYRWGKLIDSEKSRFIDEIDSQYRSENMKQKILY